MKNYKKQIFALAKFQENIEQFKPKSVDNFYTVDELEQLYASFGIFSSSNTSASFILNSLQQKATLQIAEHNLLKKSKLLQKNKNYYSWTCTWV